MDSIMQETILIGLLMILAAFILWLIFRRRQTMIQLQYHRLEVVNRMIDKFGSGQEFSTFLQTDEGKRLLSDGTSVPGGTASSGSIVLRYVQASIILLALSLTFFVNASRYVGMTDPNEVMKSADLNYWGTLTTGLAFGLLAVALVTYLWQRRQFRHRNG